VACLFRSAHPSFSLSPLISLENFNFHSSINSILHISLYLTPIFLTPARIQGAKIAIQSFMWRDGDFLHFFLCEPGKYVTRITARPSDTCAMLSALFPDRSRGFIFNGAILTPRISFASCGVRTNDTVVGLIDRGGTLGEVRQWVESTKKGDAFDEMIRSVMNIPTRPEVMRLRDFALMKAEMRPRQIRRAMKKYAGDRQPAGVSDVNTKSVIGEVPTELSTERLPVPCSW
jgi:hypothetical protein